MISIVSVSEWIRSHRAKSGSRRACNRGSSWIDRWRASCTALCLGMDCVYLFLSDQDDHERPPLLLAENGIFSSRVRGSGQHEIGRRPSNNEMTQDNNKDSEFIALKRKKIHVHITESNPLFGVTSIAQLVRNQWLQYERRITRIESVIGLALIAFKDMLFLGLGLIDPASVGQLCHHSREYGVVIRYPKENTQPARMLLLDTWRCES